jgi:sucrose-6-phosphate hydrolase SacC (GH32 family)
MRFTTKLLVAAASLASASAHASPLRSFRFPNPFNQPLGDTNNCTEGPCAPGNDQCGAPFDQSSPQYHIRDLSCGENDPNFPLYDPNHQLYHHFYQDHLAEVQGGNGMGPVIGHAVSADMVFWAHLPVAVWNDQPYDNVAIYTGSATIVNGECDHLCGALVLTLLGH